MADRHNGVFRLIGELVRRRVFRTAALYVVLAVVVVEATESAVEPLGLLPLRTLPLVAWAAILGFPLAVGLAWTFDVTPRGIVRTPGAEPEADRRRRRAIAEVELRLVLTGLAATAVGATTWLVMKPLLPRVEIAPALPAVEPGQHMAEGRVMILPPVAVGGGGELADRVATLLAQRLWLGSRRSRPWIPVRWTPSSRGIGMRSPSAGRWGRTGC